MAHTLESAEKHGHHVVPKKTLITVFVTLIGLTVVTVAAAFLDLGFLNVPLALAIAAVKAALVVAIFMGLKYDNAINNLVFSIGAIFVVVFLTFTMFDTAFRGDLGNADEQTIQDVARREEQLKVQYPGLFGNNAGGSASADTLGGADSLATTDTLAVPKDTTSMTATDTAATPVR